jgi:hypothetical protein
MTAAAIRDVGGPDEAPPAFEHVPSEDTVEVTGA